jgi:hypothetical protein
MPWYRRLLGDEAVGTIGLPSGATDEDRLRIHEAFPEAVIFTTGGPTGSSQQDDRTPNESGD